MFIRQRRTLLDPFLLKVVCPFLQSRGHYGLLTILVNYWNPVVDEPAPRRRRRTLRRIIAHTLSKVAAAVSVLLWPLSIGKRSS
ncbi:MAG: hypothetical protein ACUVX1_14180 [Chloroflexota bacterium]